MKIKFILLPIVAILYLSTSAQKYKYKPGDIIKTKTSIFVNDSKSDELYSVSTEKKEDESKLFKFDLNKIESNILLRIVKIDSINNKYSVQALNFKVYKKKKFINRNNKYHFVDRGLSDKTINADLYNNKTFEIDKNSLENSTDFPSAKKDPITIGILSLPFKYRPGANEVFSLEFNINTSIAVLIKSLYSFDIYVQGGVGIGSVGLNTTNSKGIEAGNEINASVLTGLMGAMIQYKKVQAGIYIGVDFLNNQNLYGWESNKHAWYSIGIGYELFSVSISDKKSKNKN